jgi:hypothetical protein
MYDRELRYDIPRTVEDVVELLISDLLTNHREALTGMSENDFDTLYQAVAPYILHEFRLWTGNNELLNACLAATDADGPETDPAMIILRRVKQALREHHGVLIIT